MILQADIYSLGVLLWEIVTAEIPERGRMRPVQVSNLTCATLPPMQSPNAHAHTPLA